MTRMKWSPKSPDLSPIENARGYMKTYFGKQTQYPKNKDEFWLAVQRLWNVLPSSYFEELVGSMSSRVLKVIERNGASIKY